MFVSVYKNFFEAKKVVSGRKIVLAAKRFLSLESGDSKGGGGEGGSVRKLTHFGDPRVGTVITPRPQYTRPIQVSAPHDLSSIPEYFFLTENLIHGSPVSPIRMGQTVILVLVLLFASYSSGGPVPVDESPQESCLVKNVTYAKNEEVPEYTPCETCRCDPPNVVCTMVKCQTNSGCKIIQKANRCCPEYKCECELNGKTYNNGEKIDNSQDPCQVCYCRGGEVMCTSITCYHRTDCAPVQIPGRCCPKYDHCPTLESSNQTSKQEMQPWLMTKSAESTTQEPHPPKFPQTIKIVEILPTVGPLETSSGPRIVTNGDERKKTEVEVLSLNTTESEFTTFNSSDFETTLSPEYLSGGTFEDTTPYEEDTEKTSILPIDTSPFMKLTEEAVKMNAPILHIYSPSKPEETSEVVVKSFSESSSTGPVLLTPDDLRTLAEYLIHEKIKPAPSENNTITETVDDEVFDLTSPSTETENSTVSEIEHFSKTLLEEIEKPFPLVEADNETEWSQSINATSLAENVTLSDTTYTTDIPASSSRGSSRQIEDEEDDQEIQVQNLDEQDQMLVEDFFKKHLNV